MTALATIFALTPMALGITGHGGFISQPLAIVVIGGLVSSTVLTLLVLPDALQPRRGGQGAARRCVVAGGSAAATGSLEPVLVGAGAAGAAEPVLTRRELRTREAAAAGSAAAASAEVEVPTIDEGPDIEVPLAEPIGRADGRSRRHRGSRARRGPRYRGARSRPLRRAFGGDRRFGPRGRRGGPDVRCCGYRRGGRC